MKESSDTTSILSTNESNGSNGFLVPQRLLRHLKLFSDSDLRVYLALIGKLSPEWQGDILISETADDLGFSVIILRKSLLRLMAFGLIKMDTLGRDENIIRIELISDLWRSDARDSSQRSNKEQPYSDKQPLDHTDLARHISESLDDRSHYSIYKLICETVDEDKIQRALDEALRVPQEKIKKSRSALFIHLIRKYAKP